MLGSPQHPVFCGCHTVWANAMDLSEQCMMDGLSGTIPPTEIFMDPNLSQQDKVRGALGVHRALAVRGHGEPVTSSLCPVSKEPLIS